MTAEESFPGFSEPDRVPRKTEPECTRSWSVLEDLVVWAVLVPRGNRADYRTACAWLCEHLNRMPTSGPLHQKVVTQIEHRTVTINMEYGDPDRVRWANDLYGGRRAGLPLSWADRHGVVAKWRAKPDNERARVETVITLMGRTERDDAEFVSDYLHVLDMGRTDDQSEPNPLPDSVSFVRLAQQCARQPKPALWEEFVTLCQGV